MTEPLKFEVGKHYRTRNGDKLLCVHVLKCGKPIVVNEAADTYGHREPDGAGARRVDPGSGPWDIVGEWREPRTWTVCIVEYSTEGDLCATLYPGNRKVLAAARVTEGEGLETKETDR